MKIFQIDNSIDVVSDWGLDHRKEYSIKIAALPTFYNQTNDFSYRSQQVNVNEYDLVLLSDIEFRSQKEITDWANTVGIKNYLLAIGGKRFDETIDSTKVVYRPWWSFNILKFNQAQHSLVTNRPFYYDALLGARRPHRDFVALASRYYNLEDHAIVNYRAAFPGDLYNALGDEAQSIFGVPLNWPFVSKNLDPSWEVDSDITNKISPYVPWKIWQQTYFSVVCETCGFGDAFFMSEKSAKAFFGRRLFVMFSTPGFLKGLKALGFETFSSIIDESYDDVILDVRRWERAFEQVKYLCQQDLLQILKKVQPIVDHNFNRLLELEREKRTQMRSMVEQHF